MKTFRLLLLTRPRTSNATVLYHFSSPFHRKKAAAEGAVIWYTKQLVRARAARATFGVEISAQFQTTTPSHRVRQSLTYVDVRGQKRLNGLFDPLVLQVFYLVTLLYALQLLLIGQSH